MPSWTLSTRPASESRQAARLGAGVGLGVGQLVVGEFLGGPLPMLSQHPQDSPFEGEEGQAVLPASGLPVSGRPVSSCLAPPGRQRGLNVGSPISGQSGLSSLLPQVGSGSSPGACKGAGRRVEAPPHSPHLPTASPTPSASFCPWAAVGQVLPGGPATLRRTTVNGHFAQRGPRPPPAPGPNASQQGSTSPPRATLPSPGSLRSA